jgi:hypothetical protein
MSRLIEGDFNRYLCVAVFFLVSAGFVTAQTADVIRDIHHDRSPRIKTIAPRPEKSGVKRVISNPEILPETSLNGPITGNVDPVVQMSPGLLSIPSTTQNFEGITSLGYLPPDTSGEAGLNHYVQLVNRHLAIFDKTGVLLYGPVSINTLWAGFGGLCESTNQGDPVVIYDQLASRWIITQFAYQGSGTTHLECVAVSTTSDPTGSYFRYSFAQPNFNDYPKIGVWPDGYYATFILRNPDWSVVSGRICAFDRNKMLTGAAATAQCFNVGKSYIGLLPADLDGITPPPPGSPHYSVNLSTTALNLWKVRINWTSPSSSTITGPTSITVAAYSRACSTGINCIPQPGVTQKLDSFSDRLMFRLSYRNFGDRESLYVNHSVDSGSGIAGVRWYEIRNPNSSPSLFQQSTYAPNSNNRWMGSIASDLNGNIAVGYSIASGNLFPGIRYTGRLVNDPKNSLPQGESVIMDGTGSQTHNRWGDYSQMTIDPTDDCTFWYTSEYIPSNGSFNWHTRIASFKFPTCGCAAPAGITNNTAADLNMTADSGVLVTWSKDAVNWGDNRTGNRTYDVLRNGSTIASALNYGTASFHDDTGVNGQIYNYSINYRNGCGQTKLTSGASAADFVCGSTSQLLKNAGFESGRTLWTASPTTIINNSNSIYPTHSGSWKATLNGKGIANTAYIYQQITIPANLCAATLSFWLRVFTSETSTIARDTLKVEILNTSGVVLSTLATYSNLNKSVSYVQKTLNLASFAGKTIRLRFRGVENSAIKTSFLIDDAAVNITQ